MIENDVVIVDVLKLCERRKVVLSGCYAAIFLPCHKGSRSQAKIVYVVSEGAFNSGTVAPHVVEGYIKRNKAKLAFIDVAPVNAEVAVLGPLQMRRELMCIANVPGIVGLGVKRGAHRKARPAAGPIQFGSSGRDTLKVRHLEIACETRVNCRVGTRLIEEVDRRAKLTCVDKTIGPIPARTEVDAELFRYLPSVLQIEA